MKIPALPFLSVIGFALVSVFSAVSFSNKADLSLASQLFAAMGMPKAHQRNVEKLYQLKIAARPELAEHKEELRAIFQEKLSWKELEPLAEGIVSKNFTERELEQMKTFYSTSAGRKSLELLPLILADVIDKGRLDVDKEIEILVAEKSKKKQGKK
jgi:hypothetical protein